MEEQGFLKLVRCLLVELFQTLDMEVVWVFVGQGLGETKWTNTVWTRQKGFENKCWFLKIL